MNDPHDLYPLQSIFLRVETGNLLLVQFDGMVATDELSEFAGRMFAIAGRRYAAAVKAGRSDLTRPPAEVMVRFSIHPARAL
jgi:hypothetical protein